MSDVERRKIIRQRVNEIEEKFKTGQIKPPHGVGAVAVNIYTGEVKRIDPRSDENIEMWKNMALQDSED